MKASVVHVCVHVIYEDIYIYICMYACVGVYIIIYTCIKLWLYLTQSALYRVQPDPVSPCRDSVYLGSETRCLYTDIALQFC